MKTCVKGLTGLNKFEVVGYWIIEPTYKYFEEKSGVFEKYLLYQVELGKNVMYNYVNVSEEKHKRCYYLHNATTSTDRTIFIYRK